QSTFSNSHFGLGERILGSDGTIEHGWEKSDMVNGEEGEFVRYSPEKINHPQAALTGKTKDQDHMTNWIECIRTRKTPNASVEIGYRSAIAAHMANLAYRRRQRITLEDAKAVSPQF
ncbi:MAG: hypothetical protein WAN38_01325, partial [Terriglobales bacterium]